MEYAITAKLTARMRAQIEALPESAWRLESGGHADPGRAAARRRRRALHAPELAELSATMSSGTTGVPDLSVRVVVRRRRRDDKQKALYQNDDGTTYHAVLTNRDLSAEALLSWADGAATWRTASAS